MRKVYLILLAFALNSFGFAQTTCNQTFSASGSDDDPTVLTINAADVNCNGGDTPISMQLTNAAESLVDVDCSDWYVFDLAVTGGVNDGLVVSSSCGTSFNGVDITGFTSLTITSEDNDFWSDSVTIEIDVEVTFNSTSTPNCDATLTETVDLPITGDISWDAASGAPDGYNLTVGTTSGGSDVLATTDVGNVTTYNIGPLTGGATYYVTIEPYNSFGTATGCTEQTFMTFNSVQGDFFNDPLPITPSPEGSTCDTSAFTFSYDFSSGISDSDLSSTCGSTSTFDMFFSWTATSNALVWNDGASNPGVAVYDTMGNQITCLSSFASTDSLLSGWSVGDELIIQVYDFGNTAANPVSFCLAEFTLPDPPVNDECSAAIDLTVNTDLECGTVTSATNYGATASPQPDDATGTPDNDVWFTFTATSTSHTVSLLNVTAVVGTNTDMAMSVFDDAAGCNMTSTNEVGESDPNSLDLNGLTPGSVYYVRVYGWSSAQTNFDICIGTPPANDTCEGAISITPSADNTCSNMISGTTEGTTASTSGCTGGKDVWYSFTATADSYIASVTETFESSSFISTYISAWEGSCGSLTQIGSSTSCFNTSDLTIPTVVGETYYIAVRSSSTSGHVDFDLCLYPAPPIPANDACTDATAINYGETLSGYTLSATGASGDSCNGTIGNDVWYTFTGDGSTAVITVTADTVDQQIGVFESTDCSNLDLSGGCIASVDGFSNPSVVTIPTTDGATYLVRVGSWSSTAGDSNFDISLGTIPDNDDCANATEVGTTPFTDTVDATGATNNDGFITECTTSMNDGVWYTFVGDGTDVTIEAVANGWDVAIGVYTGSCGTFTCEDSMNNGASGVTETLTIPTTNGTLYYVNFGHSSSSTDESEGPLTVTFSGGVLSTNDLLTEEGKLTVYPNPVQDALHIEGVDVAKAQVYNLSGQLMKVSVENNKINVNHLQKGTYILQTSDENGNVTSTKFIKK